jgi:predicted membrane protein
LGEYKGYSNCSLNEIIIEVNPTGTVSTISQSIGSLGFLFLMLVLMFVFGIVGFTLFKNEYLWVVGVFFVFLASLLLIYNTWLGYEYHKYISGLPISGIPETIFYVLLLIIVLGILVSLALLFTYWKEIFKYVKSEIKKKDESQDTEDWDFDEWENRLNR